MNSKQILEQIKQKKSFLCVGLDTEINKIPKLLLDEEYPLFEFNRRIIESTAAYTIAYKPNLAFYESLGAAGWVNLGMTVNYLRENHPDIFLIADAKRGDIGNTSRMYARTFFEEMDFDAVTVAPYMGEDSVTPFLGFRDKWVILLAVTSNPGANNFQFQQIGQEFLYQKVLKESLKWGNESQLMYVVGATRASMLAEVRKIVPNHFLLVPGVGAQGGSLQEVAQYGMNKQCGLIVNSSRAIIYADCTDRFDVVAGEKARDMQQEMKILLKARGIV
jgi:orotidine-5'-phosphate decarboxylase